MYLIYFIPKYIEHTIWKCNWIVRRCLKINFFYVSRLYNTCGCQLNKAGAARVAASVQWWKQDLLKQVFLINNLETILESISWQWKWYISDPIKRLIYMWEILNWYFWKYSIHILLKPIWEDFENEHLSILLFTLNILCHCPSLGLERKLTFSSASMVIHSFLQGIFPNRNWTRVSRIVGRFFTP